MEKDSKNIEFQEEISKILEKYRLAFECPHCHNEINETHFSEGEKAFKLINEKVRAIAEREVDFRKSLYNQQWLKQMEENRNYEEFTGFVKLKVESEKQTKIIEKLEKDLQDKEVKYIKELAEKTSFGEIKKLDWFKELEGKLDAFQKENGELKIGNQPEIQRLKVTIEGKDKEIAKLQSSDEIEKLGRVKELKGEIDNFQKEIKQQADKLSELNSSEYVERLDRVQKLVKENNELREQNQSLKDQGRMSKKKGENFEQYVFEELSRVFDNEDKIDKITHLGEKADFLQKIFTESGEQAGQIIYEVKNEKNWDKKWEKKLENDMANEKADFGIIIAICENGKPLRCLDPRKKIYVSDDEQFINIAKIMRDSLIHKHNYLKKGNTDEDSKEKRIKNFEEWIFNKFPQYLSRLDNELNTLKKNSYHADKINEITRNAEINIRKIILEEVRTELNSL